MTKHGIWKKSAALTLSLILVAQVTACGTILHPERKGQSGGRIDPSIAILNGIGLLFFVIPGLVAFVVDFHNGTIYLPGGLAELTDEELQHVVQDGELNLERLEEVLTEKTGMAVSLADDRLLTRELDQGTDVQALLIRHQPVLASAQ